MTASEDDTPLRTRREWLRVGMAATFAALRPSVQNGQTSMPSALRDVKALTFDVFGTVVDWRSSIIREGEALGKRKNLKVDWVKFADAWRAGYSPAMSRVRKGELPWMKIDDLHRLILDQLLIDFQIAGLTEAEKDNFNRVWHRLDPWPDAIEGLTRLRKKYLLVTLSNGNVSLLVNMAKRAGLPWDCVLSAEIFKHYKPDPEVYKGAAELLGFQQAEVMMVAAHYGDLRAAKATGQKTAFVARPLEYGPGAQVDTEPDPAFEVNATSFTDLAAKLGL